MVIRDAKLDKVCGITSEIYENPEGLPEFAFAGKSNVGKSSLINALMNRKSLARTSGEPGKTRTVNFYRVDAFEKVNDTERLERPMYFVDLPGYGYARVSRSESEKWGGMIEGYLKNSSCLRLVFLLVDIRHDPGANDRQMYEWVRMAGFTSVVIATKSDKIKRSQLTKQMNAIKKGLGADGDTKVIPFSALSKDGLEKLYELINDSYA